MPIKWYLHKLISSGDRIISFLNKRVNIIGRCNHVEIKVNGSQFAKHQCMVMIVEDLVFIQSLSHRPTYVNNEMVTTYQQLNHNDIISLTYCDEPSTNHQHTGCFLLQNIDLTAPLEIIDLTEQLPITVTYLPENPMSFTFVYQDVDLINLPETNLLNRDDVLNWRNRHDNPDFSHQN